MEKETKPLSKKRKEKRDKAYNLLNHRRLFKISLRYLASLLASQSQVRIAKPQIKELIK